MTDRYEKIRKVLTECRDIAMEWTLRGRIPECGKFGEIAQDLDAVCSELETADSERAQQPAEGEEVMVKTPNDVLFILPLQPSGLSRGPRFVVHVPLVEAPAVKALQAEIEGLRIEVERVTWEVMDATTRAERLAEALRRYRNEVPLGHQPHMLAHEVDDLLRDQEEGK